MKKLSQVFLIAIFLLYSSSLKSEKVSISDNEKYEVHDLLAAKNSNEGLEKINPKSIPISIIFVQSKDYNSGLDPNLIGEKVASVLGESGLSYLDFDQLSKSKQRKLRKEGVLVVKVTVYRNGAFRIYSKLEREIFFQTDTDFYQEISPSWHRFSFGVVARKNQVKAIFDYLDKDTKIFSKEYKKANQLN